MKIQIFDSSYPAMRSSKQWERKDRLHNFILFFAKEELKHNILSKSYVHTFSSMEKQHWPKLQSIFYSKQIIYRTEILKMHMQR
jgi:hypothetical protein